MGDETMKPRDRAPGAPQSIGVEVVYALPAEAVILHLQLAAGTTVREALEQSGILRRYPGIEIAPDRLGIWGRAVGPDAALRDGDRIEIYRPLIADPKAARSVRAKQRGRR